MSGGLWFCAGVLATMASAVLGIAIGTFIDRACRLRDQGGQR